MIRTQSLPDGAMMFLAAYSAGGAASVVEALTGSECGADEFASWCRLPAFQERMHGMLSSLEDAPMLDPFALPPLPSVTCTVAGVALALDPFGPLHGSFAYDHNARRFTNGKRASELQPGDIEWFNTAASWKVIGQ